MALLIGGVVRTCNCLY